MSQVDFIKGCTRMFGIVGDPIAQVRSPEMITWEFHRRGIDAVLVPIHVPAGEFEVVMGALKQLSNFEGFILTIPFKTRGMALVDRLGLQAQVLGGINQMVKRSDGGWSGDILDGMGCVAAFRHRGLPLQDQRLMIMGLGGAGGAIACAIAAEQPRLMRIHDLNSDRCTHIQSCIQRISPQTKVEIGTPTIDHMDILINATPVGMLNDSRLPILLDHLPKELVVFDAIVMPEMTPLLQLAKACGCTLVQGREMMLGQIPRLVEGFLNPDAVGAIATAQEESKPST
jgi:shikimate dehydrogenase